MIALRLQLWKSGHENRALSFCRPRAYGRVIRDRGFLGRTQTAGRFGRWAASPYSVAALATRNCAASTYRSVSLSRCVCRSFIPMREVIAVQQVQPLKRWLGRVVSLDLHRDFHPDRDL